LWNNTAQVVSKIIGIKVLELFDSSMCPMSPCVSFIFKHIGT